MEGSSVSLQAASVALGVQQVEVNKLGPQGRVEFVLNFLGSVKQDLERIAGSGFRTLEEIMSRANPDFNERVVTVAHERPANLSFSVPCEVAHRFNSVTEGEVVHGIGVSDMRAEMRCSDLILSASGQLIVWDQYYRRSFQRNSSYDVGVKRVESLTSSKFCLPTQGELTEIVTVQALKAVLDLVHGLAEAEVQADRRRADTSAGFLCSIKGIKGRLHFPGRI